MTSNDRSSVCELAESWCDTEMQGHQVKYIWAIDNFDFREAVGNILSSPAFSAANDHQTEWCLKVYPNGNTEAKDTVSLYVFPSPSRRSRDSSNDSKHEKIFFKISASILDCSKKNVLYVSPPSIDEATVHAYDFSIPKGWGYGEFVSKNDDFKNNLLFNNKLTIICTIIYFYEHTQSVHRCNSASLYPNVSPCNLVESLGMLLENHKFADVVLSVKNKEYPAHKNILAARSSVFAAMFEHNFKETDTNRIEIEDMNEEVVAAMLRFIYTGKCENSEKISDGLLAAADKYDLNQLKMICAEALYKTLSVDNAMNILALADLHSVFELKSKTIKFIAERFSEIVVSTSWKNILVTHPKLIDEVCLAVAGRSPAPNKRKNHDTSPECKRSRTE